MAKPNIPTAGGEITALGSRLYQQPSDDGTGAGEGDQCQGESHEKEADQSEVLSTLLSILFVHDAGSFSSNAPRKEMAKRKSNEKKMRLNTALVARLFRALAPKMAVITRPSAT